MQQTAAAQTKTARPRKPAYRPHIRKESASSYTVQSERYTYVLYTVTVHEDGTTSCDCEGCAVWSKHCKHAKAVDALLAYNAHPEHLRPVAAPAPTATIEKVADFFRPVGEAGRYRPKGMQTCPGCGRTRWGVMTEEAWCACQQVKAQREPISLESRRRGASALAEAFGS